MKISVNDNNIEISVNDNNMEDHIVNLPKKGLKTRPYNIGMEKKGLKKYDYDIYMDMEKKDLKKLTKGQLIKLLLKQKKSKKVSNHEDLLNNNPFKDEVAQEPAKSIRPPLPPRTGKWESVNPNPFHARALMKTSYYHYQMGISPFQNQGLTDHLKRKMHEDHRNQLENHHQSIKLKIT